jgi:hypothetical protein
MGVKASKKVLFIEHVDDELITILQECERSDIQILAMLVNLYREDTNIVELTLQHGTIMRADRKLRKCLQQWIEKHAGRIKEDIDWGAFQTPYQTVRTRLKFLLRFRSMQFDATIPGGLQRMRRMARNSSKASG